MVFVLFVFCDVSLSWYACCLSVILVGLWLLVIAVWLVWWLCIALCEWCVVVLILVILGVCLVVVCACCGGCCLLVVLLAFRFGVVYWFGSCPIFMVV